MKKHALLALAAIIVATSHFPLLLLAQPVLDPLWSHNQPGWGHGEDLSCGVGVDSGGNVYTAGTTPSVRYTGDDFLVLKYSPSGTLLWWTRFDNPDHGNDNASKCIVDASGNVYITGTSYRSTSSGDVVIVKFNAQGQQQWASYYNGQFNGLDKSEDLVLDAAGNVYLTGSTRTGGTTAATDIVTIKYNSQGQELWAALYNGPDNLVDKGYHLAVDDQGNVYAAGITQYTGYNGSSLITIKYDAQGI